jgi:hypothetical protein
MIPTKGSTVVVVTAEPKVPWSRVPVAGVHNRGGGGVPGTPPQYLS